MISSDVRSIRLGQDVLGRRADLGTGRDDLAVVERKSGMGDGIFPAYHAAFRCTEKPLCIEIAHHR